MKALLLENIHPDAGAAFASAGFQVERVPFSPARKVLAQRLETRGAPGYALIDVAAECDPRIGEELRRIPHTIRARLVY